MTQMMRAARLHAVGEPMVIEEVPRPTASGTDVIVEVKGCGMVPNLANVLANWETWYPHMPLPPRPAIFGLDPVGVVREVGEQVVNVRVGDRVYVNPGRSCGACHECASGVAQQCDYWTLGGYFGYNERSVAMQLRYPYGGFCEYMLAPQTAIVPLPENLEFRQATRMGYLGTAYAAVKKLGPLAGKTIIVNGATGTLGVGVTMLALAMGAARIFAVARGGSTPRATPRPRPRADPRLLERGRRHGGVGPLADRRARRRRHDRHARRRRLARVHAGRHVRRSPGRTHRQHRRHGG